MTLSGRNISVVNTYFLAKPKTTLSTPLVFDESGVIPEDAVDADADGVADVADVDCNTDGTLLDNDA
jgi:hypothetical protein